MLVQNKQAPTSSPKPSCITSCRSETTYRCSQFPIKLYLLLCVTQASFHRISCISVFNSIRTGIIFSFALQLDFNKIRCFVKSKNDLILIVSQCLLRREDPYGFDFLQFSL
jgi:hypothetical protein